jgi:hypothetical protein
MSGRTIEDRLREEYFDLLPVIRRVVEQLETQVKYHVLSISRELQKHERLVVTSRIKECESALDAVRRQQELGTFDAGRPELYTLASLHDLAGVRVQAFPRGRLSEIDVALRRASRAGHPIPCAANRPACSPVPTLAIVTKEANSIVVWIRFCTKFALRNAPIALGFLDPLLSQRRHREWFPCR